MYYVCKFLYQESQVGSTRGPQAWYTLGLWHVYSMRREKNIMFFIEEDIDIMWSVSCEIVYILYTYHRLLWWHSSSQYTPQPERRHLHRFVSWCSQCDSCACGKHQTHMPQQMDCSQRPCDKLQTHWGRWNLQSVWTLDTNNMHQYTISS